MDVVVDSSSLISLAWAGLLGLVQRAPVVLVVPAPVWRETVVEGLAHGHPDAAAIEAAMAAFASTSSEAAGSADEAVLAEARAVGALLSNDVALGRRAANLGALWLRSADLVVLCVRTGRLDPAEGVRALEALRHAGRITEALLDAYRKELS